MSNILHLSADASHTVYSKQYQTHYHSIHGAIQESQHVFINCGLGYFLEQFVLSKEQPVIRIFEMGFGTGLNAFLTFIALLEQQKQNTLKKKPPLTIFYETVEAHPLPLHVTAQLNYANFYKEVVPNAPTFFSQLHSCPSNKWQTLTIPTETGVHFNLFKHHATLQQVLPSLPRNHYNLIYFDAFDPNAQPELWHPYVFEALYTATAPQGVVTTYGGKGVVRRALQCAGWHTQKLPGPPGKRQILRAIKN